MMYGRGISHEGEILDLGAALEIVQKSGAWFSYGETRLGQGRDNAQQFFVDHPEMAEEIEAKIRENADKLFNNPLPPAPKTAPERHGAKPVDAEYEDGPDDGGSRYDADIDIEADDK